LARSAQRGHDQIDESVRDGRQHGDASPGYLRREGKIGFISYHGDMRIASITSGAAGMFCGSCLRDNTLATALIARGHDCLLIPTFTPLTLDEPDASTGRVFLGGINVFLDEYTAFRWIPRWARRWLDRPNLLRWASKFSGIENYEKLGEMTLSMLRGDHGRQRREFAELTTFLADYRPDVVLLTNVLLSAIAPMVAERLRIPVVATLQGDDIFLDALTPAHQKAAKALIRQNSESIRGFIATSRYYADHMADHLGIRRDRIQVVYPGINPKNHADQPELPKTDPPTLGYFARIAPEKGLHQLVEAFVRVQEIHKSPARLRISGWLGPQNRDYLNRQMDLLRSKGLNDRVEHVAVNNLAEKVRFLRGLNVFSVPTVYREPKGLYLLEAMASGVPVVVPRHGAAPELVEATGGGVLVTPGDASELAATLADLLDDSGRRGELGAAGRAGVLQNFTADRMARDTVNVLQDLREIRV
jgi:glycosyltransferase involved in cell wall biosynthesis